MFYYSGILALWNGLRTAVFQNKFLQKLLTGQQDKRTVRCIYTLFSFRNYIRNKAKCCYIISVSIEVDMNILFRIMFVDHTCKVNLHIATTRAA